MLKIRFLKTGRKNQPFYQIVVTDSRNAPQGGRFIEKLGFFNPFTKEQKMDEERIKHWLAVGAQASGRVHNLLVDAKIIEGPKVDVARKPKKDGESGEGTSVEQKAENPSESKEATSAPIEKTSEEKTEVAAKEEPTPEKEKSE